MATQAHSHPAAKGWWPGIAFFVIVWAAVMGAGVVVALIRQHPEGAFRLWPIVVGQLIALVPAWRAYKRDLGLDIQGGFLILFVQMNALAWWALS